SARWEDMKGDERVRSCVECHRSVYDLSRMKREDAEQLIDEAEGRVCVRFFRRADGRIMTDDCPAGIAARARRTARRAVAFVVGMLGLGAAGGFAERLLSAPRASAGVRTAPCGVATIGSL